MKFKFRLQTVYDLRQHLESEQKDALSRERQKLSELEAEKDGLAEKFSTWSKKYMDMAGAGMSPQDAVLIGQYLDDINKNTEIVSRKIAKQNEVVEKERLLLIEKMKDRKCLEKLYEKQRERFIYDMGKKEEQEIEELITSRRK